MPHNKETKYSCPKCQGHFNKNEIVGTDDFFTCKNCSITPHTNEEIPLSLKSLE